MTPSKTNLLGPAILAAVLSGCCSDRYMVPEHPNPIGTASDPFWQAQEANAEAFDFIVHEHEFVGNSARLTPGGESHVKQIAARILTAGAQQPFPIPVEPSTMSEREGDRYGFAVHNDPELDAQRRVVVVAALEEFGIANAEELVTISPAYGPGFEANEAQRAYNRFINPGFGAGIGGGLGGGGFGGGGFGGGF